MKNIIGVQDGSVSGLVFFENMTPGTRYQVYEGPGGIAAAPGENISSYGGQVGSPDEVLVPVVEHNYSITYDDEEDTKTTLTIEPADKDADYALVDANGHEVVTPETGADGWQTLQGSPGKVVFSGLDYNGTYTVVARK